jgi:cytochrome b subunit of formate dehydrogenase
LFAISIGGKKMENKSKPPNRLLIAISAIIICLCCGIALMFPDEPLKWPEEYIGFVIVSILIAFFIFPFWIKALWNSVVPAIGPFKEIDYWRALGLAVLVSILEGRP